MSRITPSPPDELINRWKLRLAEAEPLAETNGSILYKVLRRDGRPAVLKHLKDGWQQDERMGGALMAWYGGECAADMYEFDDNAQLMEFLDGPQLLDRFDVYGDDVSINIIASVIMRMHGVRSAVPPQGLTPLKQRFVPLSDKAAADKNAGLDSVFVKAAHIVGVMLETQTDPSIPLHGDVHHENILGASGHGWKIIDPKGLIGDPAYEFSNIYCNPLSRPDITQSKERILEITRLFAAVTQYDEERLLSFGAGHAALSSLWSREDGNHKDAEARESVAKLILEVL